MGLARLTRVEAKALSQSDSGERERLSAPYVDLCGLFRIGWRTRNWRVIAPGRHRIEPSRTLTWKIPTCPGNAGSRARPHTSPQGRVHSGIVDKLPLVVVILLLKFLERFFLRGYGNADDGASTERASA